MTSPLGSPHDGEQMTGPSLDWDAEIRNPDYLTVSPDERFTLQLNEDRAEAVRALEQTLARCQGEVEVALAHRLHLTECLCSLLGIALRNEAVGADNYELLFTNDLARVLVNIVLTDGLYPEVGEEIPLANNITHVRADHVGYMYL